MRAFHLRIGDRTRILLPCQFHSVCWVAGVCFCFCRALSSAHFALHMAHAWCRCYSALPSQQASPMSSWYPWFRDRLRRFKPEFIYGAQSRSDTGSRLPFWLLLMSSFCWVALKSTLRINIEVQHWFGCRDKIQGCNKAPNRVIPSGVPCGRRWDGTQSRDLHLSRAEAAGNESYEV